MKYDNTIPSFYFVIPSFIGFDTELTLYEVFLYGIISSLCNTFGFCFATNSYLSQLRKVDPSTVTRSLAHLQAKGYIKIDIDKVNGNQRKIYIVDPIVKNAYTPIVKNADSKAFNNKYNNNNIYNKGEIPEVLKDFYNDLFNTNPMSD